MIPNPKYRDAPYELVFWFRPYKRVSELPKGMARRFKEAPPEDLKGDAFWEWARANEVPPYIEQ